MNPLRVTFLNELTGEPNLMVTGNFLQEQKAASSVLSSRLSAFARDTPKYFLRPLRILRPIG
jgi:hypothetical protein